MPILVRPVREQLEHDRIIRLLQVRYQRKHDSVANINGDPPTSIVLGTNEYVPDLILLTEDKARKLEGVVEVETGESVNSLETLAQWAPFSRLRVPFHLYIPPQSLDTARRLCRDHNVTVAELWTYHTNLDQVRFTLVQKAPDAAVAAARKAGIQGTPKLKVAPPPPPPPPPAPPPPPVTQLKSPEMKAPVRTAAQKAALGKFVAAAKASAAKHGPPPPASAAADAAGHANGTNAAKDAARAKLATTPAAPVKPPAPAKSSAPLAKAPAAAAKVPGKPTVKAAAPAAADKNGKPAGKAPVAAKAPAAKPNGAKPNGKAAARPAPKPAAKAASKPAAKGAAKPVKPVAKAAAKKPVASARGTARPVLAKRR